MMKKVILPAALGIMLTTAVHAQNPDYLFMVEQAVKAPSGHNAQPWFFLFGEGRIEILPDYDKALPVVDPENRELFIGLGCAAENLLLAATQKGYAAEVAVSDSGAIVVELRKDAAVEPDALFEQIAVRQTNRRVYDGRAIPPEALAELGGVFESSQDVVARFYANGTPEFDALAGLVLAGNALQMGDEEFTHELRSWMRFNRRHQNATNDGLSYAAFGAPNLPRFIAKPAISGALNEKRQNRGDSRKIASSSHFVLLTTRGNSPREWVRCGMLLERFLLGATGQGIAHAYMNQPVEVDALVEEMTRRLGIAGGEYPMLLLRLGYGERMPYSKRRDLGEVILSE